jgi:putative ABC transport system permease protein
VQKKHQILKIVALEYTYLGVIGSLTGVILSLIGSQLLALWIFKAPFVPSAVPFTILFPGITLLVLSIGLINSKSVITNTPLEVLRKEKG